MSMVCVGLSIIGMTINTLPSLQYRVIMINSVHSSWKNTVRKYEIDMYFDLLKAFGYFERVFEPNSSEKTFFTSYVRNMF